MRVRLASVLAWLWAGWVALGCGGGGGDGGTEPTPTTGSVVGSVTDTGAIKVPLPGISARITGSGVDRSALTNNQGQYRFDNLDPGDYTVSITVPDTFSADTRPTQASVTVTAGATTTVPGFELRLRVGTVQGTVTDTLGAPLQGRTVRLRRQGATQDRGTATTNPSGQYTFANVTVGTYSVSVDVVCGETGPTPASVTVSDGMAATAPTLAVTPRPSNVLFSCDVQPIFTANCAISGCHVGANAPPPGKPMSLAAGAAYANIVNVSSQQLPSMARIKPFFPDSSYLVHKIQGTHLDVGGSGLRMPFGCSGASCLSQTQIGRIRQWVTEGAQNN
jgi:hypothetical protein